MDGKFFVSDTRASGFRADKNFILERILIFLMFGTSMVHTMGIGITVLEGRCTYDCCNEAICH